MTDKHEHDLAEGILIPVIADNPKYNGAPMGVLARKCACGLIKAFDYGNRRVMKERAQQLGFTIKGKDI